MEMNHHNLKPFSLWIWVTEVDLDLYKNNFYQIWNWNYISALPTSFQKLCLKKNFFFFFAYQEAQNHGALESSLLTDVSFYGWWG